MFLLGLYRPPTSALYPKQWINSKEFIDSLQSDTVNSSNLIVLGDIHIDNEDDGDAEILKNCVTAVGFKQQGDVYTHRDGHTLDQV